MYEGVKKTVFDGKGNILEQADTRILLEEKELKIKELKEEFNKKILKDVPLYTQCNIAMNIVYGAKAANDLNKISYHRENCRSLETMINVCKTLKELDDLFVKGSSYQIKLKG